MTPFVQTITNLLSLAVIACDIIAAAFFILLVTPLKKRGAGKKITDFLGQYAIALACIVVLASVASSLFYSEVAGFVPCLLCWWQRILLYPQVALLLIALFKNDEGVRKYCATLSAIGVIVSTYHTYLQFGGSDLIPCSASGVSCEHVYFVTYGYITIPTMALTAFALVLLLMFFKKPSSAHSPSN